MHPKPREKLRQLVLRFGKEIGQDPRRCQALLRDVCGSSYRKEVFALTSAAQEGIPAELLASAGDMPVKVLFARNSQRLHDNLGISTELCTWTVETWALALGIVSKRDLLPVTRCPSCDASLKIPAKLRGKESKCPKCGVRLLVDEQGNPTLPPEAAAAARPVHQKRSPIEKWPGVTPSHRQSNSATQSSATAMDAEIVSGPAPFRLSQSATIASQAQQSTVSVPEPIVWYVRPVGGGQFGPVREAVIRQWIAEGRISLACLVWREGWPEWLAARDVFSLDAFAGCGQSTADTMDSDSDGEVVCEYVEDEETDAPSAGQHSRSLSLLDFQRTKIRRPFAGRALGRNTDPGLSYAAPKAAWNPVVAALLSFLLPGLGQFYKSNALKGIAYLLATLLGYFLCVAPGLFMHICCIMDAAASPSD